MKRFFPSYAKPLNPILNRAHPLVRGLASMYVLNEGAGTKVFDLVRPNKTGTLTNGPTWGGSKWGRVVVLDGVSGWISLGAPPMSVIDNLTIMWVGRLSAEDSGILYQVGLSYNSGDQYDGYLIECDFTNGYFKGAPNGINKVNFSTAPHANRDYVLILRRANGTWNLFVNGVLDATTSLSDPVSPTTNHSIGFDNDTGGHVACRTNATACWSRALTDGEIMGLTVNPFGMLISGARSYSISPGISISLSGISSSEAFGSSRLDLNLSPSAIASSEAHGSTVVQPGAVSISPPGIPSDEAFGLIAIGTIIELTGITPSEAFGTAQIDLGPVNVLLDGIPTAEALGVSRIDLEAALFGIPSAEAVGAHSLEPGSVSVTLAGLVSGEAFGTTSVEPGPISITMTGVMTAEAFGALQVAPGPVDLLLFGISAPDLFGNFIVEFRIPGLETTITMLVCETKIYKTPEELSLLADSKETTIIYQANETMVTASED